MQLDFIHDGLIDEVMNWFSIRMCNKIFACASEKKIRKSYWTGVQYEITTIYGKFRS